MIEIYRKILKSEREGDISLNQLSNRGVFWATSDSERKLRTQKRCDACLKKHRNAAGTQTQNVTQNAKPFLCISERRTQERSSRTPERSNESTKNYIIYI